MENVSNQPASTASADSRRSFLRVAGVAAVTGGLLSACANADETAVQPLGGARVEAAGDKVSLPTGDVGILSFAYVLEQLEKAFYEKILDKPYPNMSKEDMMMWMQILGHERAHTEFFKAVVGSKVPDLTFDFSSIDFNDRAIVLQAAEQFELTGVGAYNGAGKYIKDAGYLTLAGKIVSVETRHHATIRNVQYPYFDAFAGPTIVTSDTGLHKAYEPTYVLPIAQKFIKEKLDASALVASLA